MLPFCGLSQLTLGGLTLEPAFDDGTVAYIASAGHSVTSTAVTATLNGSSGPRVDQEGHDLHERRRGAARRGGERDHHRGHRLRRHNRAPHLQRRGDARTQHAARLRRGLDRGARCGREHRRQPAHRDPLTATDADNDTLTYSLDTTSDAFFDIDSGGQLLTEAGLDREARNSYSVNVSVSDGKASDGTASTSADSTITVTITVENVDEPPLIVGETSIEFAENGTGTVDTYSASDPEGAAVTWLLPAGRDGTAFALSASGVLTFNAPPDHETQDMYEVILRASPKARRECRPEPWT